MAVHPQNEIWHQETANIALGMVRMKLISIPTA